MEDVQGNRAAFSGSLNETLSGWTTNWESIHVFVDRDSLEHLEPTEQEFQMLWNNQATGLHVISLPDYYRDYIIEQAPKSTPKLLRPMPRRRLQLEPEGAYWDRIRKTLAEDSDSTAATIPATLWPHQERFRQQHADSGRPARRLIADEVGLGKTLQAGIILKTRLNQGLAGKVLIIAPKAAVKQWQSELLMKFAIDAPAIDTNARTYRNGRSEPPGEPA